MALDGGRKVIYNQNAPGEHIEIDLMMRAQAPKKKRPNAKDSNFMDIFTAHIFTDIVFRPFG